MILTDTTVVIAYLRAPTPRLVKDHPGASGGDLRRDAFRGLRGRTVAR